MERWIPTSYLRNRIISAVDSRSRGAVDEEWKVSLFFMFNYQFLQFSWDHLSSERMRVRACWHHTGQTQQTLVLGWGRGEIMNALQSAKTRLKSNCVKAVRRERGGKMDRLTSHHRPLGHSYQDRGRWRRPRP